MKLGLEGQVALVTGGGQGVGRQICIELAAEGASVVVNDLFAPRAQQVADEITAAGGKAMAAPADITRTDQVEAMVANAAAQFGAPVTVLVNNAGIIPERREKGGRTPAFLDMPVEDWAKIVNLNVYGTMHCCRSVLPGMVSRQGGHRRLSQGAGARARPPCHHRQLDRAGRGLACGHQGRPAAHRRHGRQRPVPGQDAERLSHRQGVTTAGPTCCWRTATSILKWTPSSWASI